MIKHIEAGPRYSVVGSRSHGMLICLLGVDGAGKSTQAQRLIERLRSAGYDALYVWGGRRATVTAPLVQMGKAHLKAPQRPREVSGSVNGEYRSYVSASKRMFRGRLLRATWRNLTISEHVTQLWKSVSLSLLRGTIVVCDRYLYDTLVNQAVLFGTPPTEITHSLPWLATHLVPYPTLGFWIDVPPKLAFSRKPDVYDIEQLAVRIPYYRALAANLGLQRLDGTLSADAIADTVWAATLRQLSLQAEVAC